MKFLPNLLPAVSQRDREDRSFNEANLAPTKAKRQHYVPLFYLARFAFDERIAVHDLQDAREFRTSPLNSAVEKQFNDLNIGSKELSTEDWLGRIEGLAAPIIDRLVDDPEAIGHLSDDEENNIARYIAAQRFRVPAFRELEAAGRKDVLDQIKPIARSFLDNTFESGEAADVWSEWEKKPDEWWLHLETPIQDANVSTYMLGEIQGWANLLLAMDWRVGVCGSTNLYTSDNPVSGYGPAVRPWWATGAALWEKGYVFALSPRVLLWIYPMGYGGDIPFQGQRSSANFSKWEASVALHVITQEAPRFLLGKGPYITRGCAYSCLYKIGEAKVWDAIRLQGYDPRRPAATSRLSELLSEEDSSS